MGESYSILLWDDWGGGLVRVNPRLHAEGCDDHGNPINSFTLEGDPSDEEILARHELEGAEHYLVLRPEFKVTTSYSMILACPACHRRHVDEGDYAFEPHRSHACQYCGTIWRPALVPTVGVAFLPGCAPEDAEFVPPDFSPSLRSVRPNPPPPLQFPGPLTKHELIRMVTAVVTVIAFAVIIAFFG